MFPQLARHLAGGAAAWLAFVVQGAVIYVGLLVYALATGADAGGPLAGPLLVLLAGGLAVAAVLAAIYTAVVAVATDVPVVGALLACLGGVIAVVGPTAICVGVAHGVLKASSIWRRFRPQARAVGI
ncbi:hypothetical protein GA0074695_6497 [Micromonospora viridifaciens]|uniref:Uncharacterized protein n=1 Tax=Micromonospora viridifaciens TaxID=1881 RepID=A0A1C5A1X7_MICVI|nr:hypothetical protein [Micromonospora viridifaciens]SCF39159.1 hypothetical protein GA0074695_6497 [Micromonospora viridifaciens]